MVYSMEIFDWFGVSMIDALQTLKKSEPDLIYHKIEGDEFIEVYGKGYFLHSDNDRSVIFDVRIYFKPYNDFFESSNDLRGKYGKLKTIKDFEREFGASEKKIPVLKIPGIPPTLPGKVFKDGVRKISAYSENGDDVIYIHVSNTRYIT